MQHAISDATYILTAVSITPWQLPWSCSEASFVFPGSSVQTMVWHVLLDARCYSVSSDINLHLDKFSPIGHRGRKPTSLEWKASPLVRSCSYVLAFQTDTTGLMEFGLEDGHAATREQSRPDAAPAASRTSRTDPLIVIPARPGVSFAEWFSAWACSIR